MGKARLAFFEREKRAKRTQQSRGRATIGRSFEMKKGRAQGLSARNSNPDKEMKKGRAEGLSARELELMEQLKQKDEKIDLLTRELTETRVALEEAQEVLKQKDAAEQQVLAQAPTPFFRSPPLGRSLLSLSFRPPH